MKLPTNSKINGLDIRAIAAFRFLIGCYLIYDFFFWRVSNFALIYDAKTALITTDFITQNMLGFFSWSVFNYLETNIGVFLFFGAALGVYIWFLRRTHPVLSSLAALFVYWNFAQRITLYGTGWDIYVITLLFINFVLEIIQYQPLKNGTIRNDIAAYYSVLQIGLVYTITGLKKCGDAWMDGTAVLKMLTDPLMNNYDGLIVQHSFLYRSASYFTMGLEIAILPLLFFPFFNDRLRLFVATGLLLMHLGIEILSNVGNFSMAGMLAVVLIAPPVVWDNLQKLNLLTHKKIPAAPLRLISYLMAYLAPSDMRQKHVAVNSYLESFKKAVLILIIVFIGLTNLKSLSKRSFVSKLFDNSISEKIFALVGEKDFQRSILYQNWNMYTPDVSGEFGWYTIIATTTENEQIDMYTYSAPNDKPVRFKFNERMLYYLQETLRIRLGKDIAVEKLVLPLMMENRMNKFKSVFPGKKLARLDLFLYSVNTDNIQKGGLYKFEKVLLLTGNITY